MPLVFRSAVALSFATCFAGAGPAFAQDCGSWSQPVLCEADLFATGDAGRSVRLDERERIRIAPREVLELEVAGRDQRGRRFPEQRLMLGYDEGGCGGVLNVEDRGRARLRLTARATAGRCRLSVWVPGNLNFEWELEVEVNPAARSGYSLADSEFIVRSLYRAILGRDADSASLRPAIGEVQRGNLEGLVNAMLRSPEFVQSRTGADATQLLDRFYQGVFDRPADSGGVREYLRLVESGRYAEVLLRMIQSSEFEGRLPG